VIKRTAAVFGWLVAGHVVLGGLYWALLHVPESNVLMLTTSLLLVLALVWGTGAVEGAGLLASGSGMSVRSQLVPGLKRAWLVILPLLLFAAIFWMTGRISDWFARYGSQMDAWIILKTGWTKADRVKPAFAHIMAFVRWGIGLSLALALFRELLLGGVGALAARPAWLTRAMHWKALLVFALGLVFGWLLPWHVANWHWVPASQVGTWFEPAFATVKLSMVFVWMNAVWAIVLGFVARDHVRTTTA